MLARAIKSTRFSPERAYLQPRIEAQAKRQKAECVIIYHPSQSHVTITNLLTAENNENMKKG